MMPGGDQRNPYPGLRPFGAAEAHLFFGRDDEVDAMVDRLAAQRLLAVLGGSGSGKSSLVNCGLRPALHGGLLAGAGTAWRVATCRPGGDPIGALARALAAPGVLFDGDDPAAADAHGDGMTRAQVIESTLRLSRLGLVDAVEMARLPAGVNVLVVVDQFEELFRYRRLGGAAAADDAATLVGLLLQARSQTATPLYGVLTMRSDFLGECSAIDGLAQAINDAQYLVPRMTRDERRAAIAGPAAVAGARIDPVLLTRLVNDVGENPDQLSILQHAMSRTWAHWAQVDGKGPIALLHYEDPSVGAMSRALDLHAEVAWQALAGDVERATAERLFRALTDSATDPRGIRRPAQLASLGKITRCEADALRAVIEVFRDPGRSFLMPPAPEPLTAGTVIDIAHESLMRVWQRLRGWAQDEAQSAQQLHRLADAADQHHHGRGGLWRDPELHFALQWEQRAQPNAAWALQYGVELAPVTSFLRASEAARDAERRAEASRRSRKRAALVALIVSLVAAGSVFAALWQRSEQLLVVNAARRLVLLSQAMAESHVATPIDQALLLAAGGWRLDASNETLGGLQALLDRSVGLQTAVALPGAVLGIGPGAAVIATVHGNAVQLREPATGAARGEPLVGHTGPVNAIAFSADGRMAATAADDGTLRRWDARTGAPIGAPMPGHHERVWSIAFSADGKLIASGDETGSLRLWNAASGAALAEVVLAHTLRVFALAFDPSGTVLASGSDDRSARLWTLPALTPRGSAVLRHEGTVSTLAFDPDGRSLASAGSDRVVRLWQVASGQPIGEPLVGHSGRIWSLAFSPDGGQLASAAEDRSVRLWNVANGQPVGEPLQAHKSRVWRVAYASDGASLWTGGADRVLLRWRTDGNRSDGDRALAPLRPGHALRAVATSRDGRLIAAAGDDGSVQLWDAATLRPHGSPIDGRVGGRIDGSAGGVSALAFSADSATLATAGEDGSVRLWGVASGQPRGAALADASSGPVWSVAFSPDGSTVAAGSGDGRVRLWDTTSGRQRLAPLQGHEGRVWSVAFSPDGKRLASASDDATVRLWDVASGQPATAPLRGHAQRVWSVAFSPDGRQLASAGEDGSLRRWDAATGAPVGVPLFGHQQAATAVAYSPDGTLLATASDDATLRFWDAIGGEPIGAPLQGHTEATIAVAFGAEGRALVSASIDGSLRRWDTPPVWIDRVCARLTRNLGYDAWRRLVGGVDYVAQCPALPVPVDDDVRANKTGPAQ